MAEYPSAGVARDVMLLLRYVERIAAALERIPACSPYYTGPPVEPLPASVPPKPGLRWTNRPPDVPGYYLFRNQYFIDGSWSEAQGWTYCKGATIGTSVKCQWAGPLVIAEP